jgi:hypothetical protein
VGVYHLEYFHTLTWAVGMWIGKSFLSWYPEILVILVDRVLKLTPSDLSQY